MAQDRLFPRALLVLAAAATTTPIFGGYLVGFLLLLWLPFGRRRQSAAASAAKPMRALLTPIHWGVLALVASHVLAALVGAALSPYAQSLYDVTHVAVRMGIKWGLLWIVLSESMLLLLRGGWRAREISLWLGVFMIVNLVYALAQRYTGIDWTHGLDARLGPHRFAYGVYRISGFMGHPLTLAYNLLLMLTAAGALLLPLRQSLDAREVKAWWIVATAATAILLISGSRFVLLVIPVMAVLAAGRRLLRHAPWVILAAAVVALVLWWEGSVVGRFSEFFDTNVPLTDRFSRLVFWQVHWRMFLDQPIAGVTLAGVSEAMEAYYSAIGRRDIINTAHNVFLQTMADSGLIGLGGMISLLAGIAVSAARARRLLGHASGIGLLLVATVLSGLLQNNLRDSEFLFALWFFLALLILRAAVLATTSPSGTHERKPPQDLQPPTDQPDPA